VVSASSHSVDDLVRARPDATLRSLLVCPVDGLPLVFDAAQGLYTSNGGSRVYPVVDGIPCLFAPNTWPEGTRDVTDTVRAFYEETPFPNYDDLDTRESLMQKARRGVFARLLDEQLPRPALVLEAGCGTGQLSNFLGMGWNRTVVGADLCLNSLRLAKGFRDRCSIENAHFVQMNLFRPPFADETFDVVISNGVLHHTSDPHGGFRAIAAKLKPGGHIIIGLYNWLGRLPTLWRRRLIETFGERRLLLDERLRRNALNEGRRSAWFKDQYAHPHESQHSMREVSRWFDEASIDTLSSIPLLAGEEFTDETQLFERHPRTTWLDEIATELGMLLSGGVDGGLYMMIGRKRAK
jgi:SAM-dependent methyltransferase